MKSKERENFDDNMDSDFTWDIIDTEGIEDPLYDEDFSVNKKVVTASKDDNEEEEEEDEPKKIVKEEEDEEEEEELNEEEEDDSDDGSRNTDDDEAPSAIGELAKYLAEKGLITIPEDLNLEDEDGFDKAIEYTIQEGIEQFKASLGPEASKVFEFLKNGGDIREYAEIMSAVPAVSNLDLSDDENKKTIYKEYLKETTRFSEAKINKLIEEAEIDDELEDSAAEAQEYFINKEKELEQKILEQQASVKAKQAEEREMFVSKAKSIIEKEAEIFDYPLGDKTKRKELTDYILKPTVPYTTPDGRKILITQMQADKIELQSDKDRQIKAFVFEAVQLKNKFNLDPVKSKGVTENNKRLKEIASKYKTNSSIGKNSSAGSKKPPRSGNRTVLFEDIF